jgi:uncharacterized protein (DUF1330 family)
MAAYVIVQYVIKNPNLYREYSQGAGPTLAAYGGKLVSFDVASETIEGKPPGPQTVVIEFESVEKAKAWYHSPEYQKVVGKRLAATEGHAVIAQSMNVGAPR